MDNDGASGAGTGGELPGDRVILGAFVFAVYNSSSSRTLIVRINSNSS